MAAAPPGAPPQLSRALLVVGADFRSGDADARDRMFVAEADVADFLAALRAAGIAEAMVMSTCDRVEVQAAADDPAAAATAIRHALATRAGLAAADVAAQTYRHDGPAAVRHIFAVAAGLASMIVGEPEVFGQLKAAHRDAAAAGATGPTLEATLQAAYAAAKQVRSDTAISRGPVSLAACAVRVAGDVQGDLSRAAALLVGAGDMGALMLQHFRQAGLARLTVAAATPDRAATLARTHGATAVTYDDLAAALPGADIVVAAAGLGRYLVTADMVRAALAARRRRPMFLLDAAVPGDIDPAADTLDGAYRYELDDLERVAQEGRTGREAAATEAWHIVDRHAAAFAAARAGRQAVPAVRQLRAHFEAVRDEVLADPNLDAAAATRLLVNKLLHAPSGALRGGEEAAQAMRLFGLAPSESEDPETDK